VVPGRFDTVLIRDRSEVDTGIQGKLADDFIEILHALTHVLT
jgi:hypothetical protein